jgi:hypothetical protein
MVSKLQISEMHKTIAILAVPVIFAAFVLFYNLGDRLLWGDEAETALLGVNVTKYGLPKATDGKNYITLLGAGVDTNKDDIWTWRPWLDSYIAAASFALFGKTTTAARFPFVLIAFISVLFLAFMVHRFYRRKEVTLYATLLLITNITFILHARQCRYYALVGLAQMVFIYGFHRLLTGRSKSGIICISLALITAFYCNYILVVPELLAIVVASMILYRKYPDLIKNVSIGMVIFTLFVIPWLLYAQPWHQTGTLGVKHLAVNLQYLLIQINFQIAPFLLFLVPAVLYFTRKGKPHAISQDLTENSIKIFLWCIVAAYILFLSLNEGLYLRYLLPLIPVFIILMSVMITDYVRPRFLRYLLVTVLSLSNVISVLSYPFYAPAGMPVIKYLDEITSKYHNKLEDVVLFLNKNARPEETLYVADPEFPIIFYTDIHVIDARLHRNVNKLPDWIFAQSASGTANVPELHLPSTIEKQYQLIELPVHDSPRGDCYPEPGFHASFTTEKMTKFKIYKKISQQFPGGPMIPAPK